MLLIVGPVLGGLLLITLIFLIIGAVRSVSHLRSHHYSVVAIYCTLVWGWRNRRLNISDPFRSKKHRKASSTADIGTPFISHQTTKAPLINGNKGVPAMARMPRIPRASVHNNMYSSTNLEMTPSNSQQNFITNGRNPVSVPERQTIQHGQNFWIFSSENSFPFRGTMKTMARVDLRTTPTLRFAPWAAHTPLTKASWTRTTSMTADNPLPAGIPVLPEQCHNGERFE